MNPRDVGIMDCDRCENKRIFRFYQYKCAFFSNILKRSSLYGHHRDKIFGLETSQDFGDNPSF